MNHARGRLKTRLHRGLWKEVGFLLARNHTTPTCAHWAETAGYYFAGLTKTGAYPLEMTFSYNSINELLQNLSSFNMQGGGGCNLCQADWMHEVNKACHQTVEHFQGLCLDCMATSRLDTKGADKDYWRGLGSDGSTWSSWSKKCRIDHGENTWYISWLGRDEHRQALLDIAHPNRRR